MSVKQLVTESIGRAMVGQSKSIHAVFVCSFHMFGRKAEAVKDAKSAVGV